MNRFAKLATPLLVAALTATTLGSIAAIDPETDTEYGPYHGDDMPRACAAEMDKEGSAYWYDNSDEAVCHHMAGDMNGLDDPIVDVLIVAPASPALERDLRITRQSLEMWDAGIDVVAEQLNMSWLAEGFDIRVSVGGPEYLGDISYNAESFYDPEIVVIVSNPVGGIGIGIDPVDFIGWDVPCSPIADPLNFDSWSDVDGFDSHHNSRSGTYIADAGKCGDNLGGNVCFAVNGAIDPTPGTGPLGDFFSLYDLVSHEIGHCLTIGHVGDGAEGSWAKTPIDDIMAYDSAPVRANKCVSTLNVVGIAHVMSRYLDVDGDGTSGTATDQALVRSNDPETDDGRPFFVQRPSDQYYASTTGWPWDCPQPDLGALPGDRTDYRVTAEWDVRDADTRDDFDTARGVWDRS
jgi:hypothetical protein